MLGWLYYETVRSDGRGGIVEGDHGIWTKDEEPISFGYARVTGDQAIMLHHYHAQEVDPDSAADWVRHHLGALDAIDDRGSEAIFYRADVPEVDVDVPYVRSANLYGTPYDVHAVCKELQR
jgi:hypothetical protein